ncbi:MAG: hypothetical protein MSG64_06985 [Pyrinomonadaceae bacterium MAG19_C2-C3]|nr:hypothetical protein [Pyrinomonadaceae bacterium MAG19_C2-C3]
MTDALGHVTKYFFDKSKGRNVVTRVEGACSCGGSQTKNWTYDNGLNVTGKTDALGHTETYTYDANGNRLTETDVLGTSTYTYNSFGQVLTATDRMGGITTNTYDAQGRLLTTKDALNKTTTFTYDARGLLLTATDAKGNVTTLEYDVSGNLTRKTDAAGSLTDFAYDARGRLTSTTNAPGKTTSYAYDAAGRVNKTTQPDGSYVTYTYDLAGRRTGVADARNSVASSSPIYPAAPDAAPPPTPSPTPTFDPSNDTVWVEDAPPNGATPQGSNDSWYWTNYDPVSFSGASSIQSNGVTGMHQQYFFGATDTLTINKGDVLVAYVYLDPQNLPSEIMLQWNNGDWEHRAYWGANNIMWGTDSTASRRYMGELPAAGQWVRLEVPAVQVGLEGSTLNGAAYTLYDGRAAWDHAGKAAQSQVLPTPPAGSANDTVWVEDGLPAGAVLTSYGEEWNWAGINPKPVSGTSAHPSRAMSGLHMHDFSNVTATLPVSTGEVLVAYVYLDPVNTPSEVLLQWNDGSSWEHRAYWGANNISWGADGTDSRRNMGALPEAGRWIRLEVPASAVGLEGHTLNGMSFTLWGGQATWDRAGKAPTLLLAEPTPTPTPMPSPTPSASPTPPPTPTPVTHVNDTTYRYDGAHRLTREINAAGKTTVYKYDLMSNLTGRTDALGNTTNYEYDEFNRLVKTIYPAAASGATRLTETIEYDAGGNVKKKIDQAGRITLYEYDGSNRLIKLTDPTLQITRYEYNARSNVTAIIDAIGQRYTFAYDALGRVIETSRDGNAMSFAYDAVGNRTQRTDYNGVLTNHAYDALNRLTTTAYPDATTVTYTYDKLSHLTQATNSNGAVAIRYDDSGQVSGVTDVWGQTLGYAYDANGNRTELKLGTTTIATYGYDTLNRLAQLTDGAGATVAYAYDVTNKLTSRSLPNGVTTAYRYDGLNRLTRLADATQTASITDNQYAYNATGNITQKVDGEGSQTYGYDTLDRLTSAARPNTPTESYAYDAVGNRTSSHQSANNTYQGFNKLASANGVTYQYDNNGNLITKTDSAGTTTYIWDYENRLTRVVRPDGVSVNYKYDALGRRIERSTSTGQLTKFVYDNQDVVRDIYQDGTTTDYLNGLGVDEKLRQTSAAGVFYFTADQLGSTTALTDAAGNVVERMTYDAFGNGTGSTRTRYTYTGREFDADTGLYYYRARWYDAQSGRFISEDPIGFGGGDVNLYAYVWNNPARFRDPSGLSGDALILGGGAAAAAGAAGGYGAAAAAAAAAAPAVAVAAAGAAAIYGAWQLGEWLAEQPWNPLTHPPIPPPPPITCDTPDKPGRVIPFPPPMPPGFERCTFVPASSTPERCIYFCAKSKRMIAHPNYGECPPEIIIGTVEVPYP